jgi:serine kinase of HPr protein (carbohydrate metabolism regulator)
MLTAPSIHASCVLAGATAVLIRGASGSGKSRLAHDLIEAGRRGDIPFARLVSDDRTLLEAVNGRLLARPVAALAGLLELRHIGIRELPYEPVAVVTLVVDLGPDGDRLPEPANQFTEIAGIRLPLLKVPSGEGVFTLILAELMVLKAGYGQRNPLAEK